MTLCTSKQVHTNNCKYQQLTLMFKKCLPWPKATEESYTNNYFYPVLCWSKLVKSGWWLSEPLFVLLHLPRLYHHYLTLVEKPANQTGGGLQTKPLLDSRFYNYFHNKFKNKWFWKWQNFLYFRLTVIHLTNFKILSYRENTSYT